MFNNKFVVFMTFLMATILLVSGFRLIKAQRPIFNQKKEIYLAVEKRRKVAKDDLFINVRLVNNSTNRIEFSGYSESQPWYRIQKWAESKWSEYDVGWFCGTGLRNCIIRPGGSSLIDVNVPKRLLPVRIGVDFRVNGKKKTVWTKKIS